VRSSRSAIYLWVVLAVLFVAGLLTLHPIDAELCRETGPPGQKDCATTALATLAIAAFTWTLWRATDKLWRAGENRFEFARQAGEGQARDMELSLAAARHRECGPTAC
jgi:hypothetical protein